MKVEVTSQAGIVFKVSLDADERENLKTDLRDNFEHMTDRTDNTDTDKFLEEIKKIL